MTGDCRDCRNWRGCPGREWFSYSDIQWCSHQVFWLLKYAEILHQGQWPVPDERAEVGLHGKKVIPEAPFAKVIAIIAEVDYRLQRTGVKGELLAEQAVNREKMLYLSARAKDALYYISGWKRKDRSFTDWLKDRRYRQKSDKKVVMVST